MVKKLKLDVLIPTYNEEKNIGNLLNQIKQQTIYPQIKNIYVLSDASTDKTHEIVKEHSKKDKKIKLIVKKRRRGKSDSLNIGFKKSNSDILIMLDGDIGFDENKALSSLVKPLIKNKDIGLVSLRKKPIDYKNNFASLASLFSYYLIKELITGKRDYLYNNFYGTTGCAISMPKKIYKNLSIRGSGGTDQDLFFCVIERGYRTFYADDFYVLYKMPFTTSDYLKQNIRFRKAFGKKVLNNNTRYSIKIESGGYYSSLLKTLFKHPLCFMAWAPLYLIGKFMYLKESDKKDSKGYWEIPISTK